MMLLFSSCMICRFAVLKIQLLGGFALDIMTKISYES